MRLARNLSLFFYLFLVVSSAFGQQLGPEETLEYSQLEIEVSADFKVSSVGTSVKNQSSSWATEVSVIFEFPTGYSAIAVGSKTIAPGDNARYHVVLEDLAIFADPLTPSRVTAQMPKVKIYYTPAETPTTFNPNN